MLGITTVIVATTNTTTKGQTVYLSFQPSITIAPNIISIKINIHANNTGAGNPKPVNIPVIPAGFINLNIPGINNNKPTNTLIINGLYSL